MWPMAEAQPDGPRFQIAATWNSGTDDDSDYDMQHVPRARRSCSGSRPR